MLEGKSGNQGGGKGIDGGRRRGEKVVEGVGDMLVLLLLSYCCFRHLLLQHSSSKFLGKGSGI
jgi:hypothetical protein